MIFLPLQPFEKLNNLLNFADIHVLIQKKDAADLVMPSKLSGMLASEKAIIATANQDTDIAKLMSQIGLVVPPENAAILAENIIFLYNNSELRTECGKKGRKWVEENWSKDLVLEQFSNEFECF